MKFAIGLYFILLLPLNFYAQNTVYLDENKNEISPEEYQSKWRNNDLLLSTWIHIDSNKTKYYTLKKDLYLKGVYSFPKIKDHLENLINKKIKDNNTILIEYYFKDDLCVSTRDNHWNKQEIIYRKKFTNPIRLQLKKENITYISLFEEGITLKNNPDKKNEYYFIDKDNYFREKLFIYPTACGSYGIIKPNGQYVIRNGESHPKEITKLLTDNNWQLFFNKNE